MLSNAEQRLVAALSLREARIAKGRLTDTMHQAIGRLRAAHPRAARYCSIELQTDGGGARGFTIAAATSAARRPGV